MKGRKERRSSHSTQPTPHRGQACVQARTYRKELEAGTAQASLFPGEWTSAVLRTLALTSGLCLLKEPAVTFIPNETDQRYLPPWGARTTVGKRGLWVMLKEIGRIICYLLGAKSATCIPRGKLPMEREWKLWMPLLNLDKQMCGVPQRDVAPGCSLCVR